MNRQANDTMDDEHEHNFKASYLCNDSVVFVCDGCGRRVERNITGKEAEAMGALNDTVIENTMLTHALWYKFCDMFCEEHGNGANIKYKGCELIRRLEAFAADNPDVDVVMGDVGDFTGSLVMMIPIANAIAVVFAPQSSDPQLMLLDATQAKIFDAILARAIKKCDELGEMAVRHCFSEVIDETIVPSI